VGDDIEKAQMTALDEIVGTDRLSPASRARSAGRGAGRTTYWRRTATSWRKMTTSNFRSGVSLARSRRRLSTRRHRDSPAQGRCM